MILEIAAVGGVVAAVYEYFKNASFKAKVTSDVQNIQAEFVSLQTKAISGVALVEADFDKALAAGKSLASKL